MAQLIPRNNDEVNQYQNQNGAEWSRTEQNRLANELETARARADLRDEIGVFQVERGDILSVLVKGLKGHFSGTSPVEYRSRKILDNWDHVRQKKYSSPKVGPGQLNKSNGQLPHVDEISNIWPGQYVWVEGGTVIVSDELPPAAPTPTPTPAPTPVTVVPSTPTTPIVSAPVPVTPSTVSAVVPTVGTVSPTIKPPTISAANPGLFAMTRVLNGQGTALHEASADRDRADLAETLDLGTLVDVLTPAEKTQFISYYENLMSSPVEMDNLLAAMTDPTEAEALRLGMTTSLVNAEYFSGFETYLLGLSDQFNPDEVREIVSALLVIAGEYDGTLEAAVTNLGASFSNLDSLLTASGKFLQPLRVANHIRRHQTTIETEFNTFNTATPPIDATAMTNMTDVSEAINTRKLEMARAVRTDANESFWKNDDAGLKMSEDLYAEYIENRLAGLWGVDAAGRLNAPPKIQGQVDDDFKAIEEQVTAGFIRQTLLASNAQMPNDPAQQEAYINYLKELTLAQKYNQLVVRTFIDKGSYAGLPTDLVDALHEYDDLAGINFINFSNGKWFDINVSDSFLDAESIGKEVAINAGLIIVSGGIGIAGGAVARGLIGAARTGFVATGATIAGNTAGGVLGMASFNTGLSAVQTGEVNWEVFGNTAKDWRTWASMGMGFGLGRYMAMGKGGLARKGVTALGGGYGITGVTTGEWDFYNNPEIIGNSLFNAALISFGTRLKRSGGAEERWANAVTSRTSGTGPGVLNTVRTASSSLYNQLPSRAALARQQRMARIRARQLRNRAGRAMAAKVETLPAGTNYKALADFDINKPKRFGGLNSASDKLEIDIGGGQRMIVGRDSAGRLSLNNPASGSGSLLNPNSSPARTAVLPGSRQFFEVKNLSKGEFILSLKERPILSIGNRTRIAPGSFEAYRFKRGKYTIHGSKVEVGRFGNIEIDGTPLPKGQRGIDITFKDGTQVKFNTDLAWSGVKRPAVEIEGVGKAKAGTTPPTASAKATTGPKGLPAPNRTAMNKPSGHDFSKGAPRSSFISAGGKQGNKTLYPHRMKLREGYRLNNFGNGSNLAVTQGGGRITRLGNGNLAIYDKAGTLMKEVPVGQTSKKIGLNGEKLKFTNVDPNTIIIRNVT